MARYQTDLLQLIQLKMKASTKAKKVEPSALKVNFMDQPMTLGKTKKKKTPKNEKLLVVDRTTELPSFDVVLAEKAQNSRIFNEHFEQHTHNDELRLKALQDDLAKESGNYI